MKKQLNKILVYKSGNMATRTEYQVVDSEDAGNEVRTYKTLKEAKADYNKNKNAVELRKVVWAISKDDTWATSGEADREDIILMER